MRIPCLSKFPKVITADDINEMLVVLQQHKICPRNPDNRFVSMMEIRKTVFMKSRKASLVSAYLDHTTVVVGGSSYNKTVRVCGCDVIVPVGSTRCASCTKYRSTLRVSYSNFLKLKNVVSMMCSSSHANLRYMNLQHRSARAANKRIISGIQKKKVIALEKKLAKCIHDGGLELDEPLHNDLVTVMTGTSLDNDAFPEGSFRRQFWLQQLQIAQAKDKRQARWHPLIIRWCLALKLSSSAAYSTLRDTGFISLLSSRTLCDYTHVFESKTGIQEEVNNDLATEAKLDSLEEYEKYVCVIFDEVKVKEGLVFNKHSGQIIGFIDLGSVNSSIDKLQERIDKPTFELAKSYLWSGDYL